MSKKELAKKMEELHELEQQIKAFEASDEYRQHAGRKGQLEILKIDITDDAMEIYRETGQRMPHSKVGIDMRPFVVINPFPWKHE